MEEQIKKSYNPFKMWGSYVGVIIFTLFFAYTNRWNDAPFPQKITNLIKGILFFDGWNGFIMSFLILVIGFIIGWAIHSLIRRLKN
jgi:hypothetical protein